MAGRTAEVTMPHRLDPLLRPRSIALVGASERSGSPGASLTSMVLNFDYSGRVYPVNPNYDTIAGAKCYASLAELPERVEHAVLALANERLEQALAEAIEHGVKAVTIFASCVLEDDSEPALAKRLRQMARDSGIAICGGNGMGFYNPIEQLYVGVFPLPDALPAGGISFIAQSGSAFSALAHNGVRLKFNLCVSSGNEMVTTLADYMDWSLHQDETRVIALFLESVRDSDGFMVALEKARERNVPVVMLKVGKSPMGAAMALTHTGAISGNHAAYEALARRYGIIEVHDFGELIATLQMFQSPRRPGTGNLATIFESGGLMELTADIAHQHRVPFAKISESTKAEISKYLEPGLKADNPLDAWGSNRDFEGRFYHCLAALMWDRSVASGMFVANFRDDYYLSEAFFRVVRKVSLETDKPVGMINCHGDLSHRSLSHRTRDAGIPFIDGTREGLLAVKHAFSYRDGRRRMRRKPKPVAFEPKILDKWNNRLAHTHGAALSEFQAMEMLRDFSIAVPHVELAENRDALIDAASRIGYPLVLKTAEPGFDHKTEHAGVVVGIGDEISLVKAYQSLCERLGPRVLVCQMIEAGTEIGLGMINDSQFGPLVLLASGGILIEILAERAVGLAPLGRDEAGDMLASLKSDQLLRGVRGQPPGNRDALIELVVAFSNMCFALAGHISEIDINPVIVNPHHAIAVDALIAGRS